MKLVVAIGGNALLRRNQPLTAENQLENVKLAAVQLAHVAEKHQMVLTHGNGPQVGLLALQGAAYAAVETYPLDVLDAQTEGMIGYMLEQELTNLLPVGRIVTTLLSRVEVDSHDPAFENPTKPIGPMYTQEEAKRITATKNWPMVPDGTGFRHVVASPKPLSVLGLDSIRWLLEKGVLVIAAGGGGIPVSRGLDGRILHGVDAVIDKDLCSGLLARDLDADCLIIATDVEAVYLDWGQPSQRAIKKVTPQALAKYPFPAGSMAPKVEAACNFVLATGKKAYIGSLNQIEEMLAGHVGTEVCLDGADLL